MPFERPTTPCEYDPALITRFFRSQWSKNGEMEAEEYYRPSSVIAGWSAARPFPNRVPTLYGPHALYNLPSGPTQPRQLMQQGTVPPTFPAGSYQSYLPARYEPGFDRAAYAFGPAGPGGPMGPMGPMGPAGPGGGGGGVCCPPPFSPEEQASIFAMGLKKILPELATSIGVQSARASSQTVHSRPANVDPPVRAYDFASCNPTPTSISDAAFVDISVFLVPVGWNAVAKAIGFEAESAAALSDIQFRVLVDSLPVPNLDNITCGDIGTMSSPLPVTIKAIEQQRIRIQGISLTVGVTHFVRALLKGWTFQPSLMANLDSIQGWRGQ
jgi:hypothetical protein